jgi:peroxiredoxin
MKFSIFLTLILFNFHSYAQAPTEVIPFTNWENKNFPTQDWITLDGDTLNQKYFIGKVCFFNFFDAGCPPCMKEIKYLNKLLKQYSDNDNFCLISFFRGSKEKYERFYKSNEIQSKASSGSALQLNSSLVTISDYKIVPTQEYQFQHKYHAWGVPSNLITNKKGIVSYCRVGFPMEKLSQEQIYADYIEKIDKLLNEK